MMRRYLSSYCSRPSMMRGSRTAENTYRLETFQSEASIIPSDQYEGLHLFYKYLNGVWGWDLET